MKRIFFWMIMASILIIFMGCSEGSDKSTSTKVSKNPAAIAVKAIQDEQKSYADWGFPDDKSNETANGVISDYVAKRLYANNNPQQVEKHKKDFKNIEILAEDSGVVYDMGVGIEKHRKLLRFETYVKMAKNEDFVPVRTYFYISLQRQYPVIPEFGWYIEYAELKRFWIGDTTEKEKLAYKDLISEIETAKQMRGE